jgi:hypothetical protein
MKAIFWLKAIAAASLLAVSPGWAADDLPTETHDGLRLVEGSKAGIAYVLPGADFTVYKRVALVEPGVAFRKNWQRDTNRDLMGARVRDSDMERIKKQTAALFLEVFTEELENGGYAVVDEVADDVMILAPNIINLDVTAPDLRSAGSTKNYVTSAGSASLYIEMYDSVTGQILARALDHRKASDWGRWQWATASSNRAEGRRIIRTWAQMLVTRLDEINGKR